MKRLVLFGTSACHLCEQAEAIVQDTVPEGVDYIDIAEQAQWQERYAVRIPVLYDRETKLELGWPFGRAELEHYLTRLAP